MTPVHTPLPLGPWTSNGWVPPLLTQAASPHPARSPGSSNEFFKHVEKMYPGGRVDGKNDGSPHMGDQVGDRGVSGLVGSGLGVPTVSIWPLCTLLSHHGAYWSIAWSLGIWFFFYFCSDISGLERRPKLLFEPWGWKWGREWKGKGWQGERKRESGGEKRGKGEKEGRIEGGSEGGWDGWKEGEGWGKPSPDLKPSAVPSQLELCAFAQVMLYARCPFTLWGTIISY